MKTKLTILFAMMSFLCMHAQIIYSTEARSAPATIELQENEVSEIFSDLDKSRIPTGLLLDAAIEFSDLEKYNGTVSVPEAV